MTQASSRWEGQIVNNEFHLKKYLGGSDQSAVYLTEHTGQQAAIKLIPADAANAERQLQRWELAKKMSHPHLIRVFQTGRCRLDTTDLIFAVMEHAEENLAQIVPERRLTAEEARAMLDPALEALSFLHGQGYVHGRVKPANIMAAGDQLKLSSDSVWSGGPFTDLGKTGAYDPPESVTDGTSASGDVWSLGMTLTEVLTQRLPRFNTERGIPVLPADVPQPFLDIVRGCLRRRAQSRLTVGDITAHLHSGRPLPIEKEPAAPPEKFSKQRFLVPGMIALAIVLTIIALMLLRGSPKPGQAAPEETSRPPQPVTSPTRTKPSPASPRSGAPASSTSSSSVPPTATTRSGPAGSEVVHRVLPEVPENAQETIQGTIRVGVRVEVDRAGNVVGTGFENPGPSKYFSRLAMDAAQKWKFAPSQEERRQYSLRFEFTESDTRASAVRTSK